MSTSRSRCRLIADDRGAIMVMGIFMCSCLVASLWYIAGIGDAILYRERMQEAADALALSDAALHARGMNLIVLLNLVMAVILSVRVIVRVGKLVMSIAAAIFTGLGIFAPALFAAVPPTTAAAVMMNNADNVTKPAIDGALQALGEAQSAIATTTPFLSRNAVDKLVAKKYAGVDAATIEPSNEELPVEKRNPAKLCAEAGDVLPQILQWALEQVHLGGLPEATDYLSALMKTLAKASPKYFCDLEPGGTEPNTDDLLDKPASDMCVDRSDAEQQRQFDDAEADWQETCRRVGVACIGRDSNGQPLAHGTQNGAPRTKEEQDDLDRNRLHRDQAARALHERKANALLSEFWNADACIEDAKNDMKRRRKENDELNKQQQKPQNSSSSSSPSGDIAPMLIRDFANGKPRGQFLAGVRGDTSRFKEASRIVRIGAFRNKQARPLTDSEPAKMLAVAQAEMFYDCTGPWQGANCNADDDSMWHFQWRARLRRFNEPASSSIADLSAMLGSPPPRISHDRFTEDLAQRATAPSGDFRSNAALRADLAKLLSNPTVRDQGVH